MQITMLTCIQAGATTDSAKHNATALSDSEVTLKLNKKGTQPMWVFDIRGMVCEPSLLYMP